MTQYPNNIRIIKSIKDETLSGKEFELVEIVESSVMGTPRKEGAFMFVDSSGKSFGTVGGGNVEWLATSYALELLKEKKDAIKVYNLSQKEASNIGMVCGGDSTMKFTYICNDEKSLKLIEELEEKNKSKNTVYVFGGGHISVELSKLFTYLNFNFVVWDDRKEFANRDRFPDAREVICNDYNNVLDRIHITKKDFVVIMTRGHVSDYEVEKQVLKSDAFYIGVIGSKNKCKVIRDKLIVDGFTSEELDRVKAPIGLDIKSETPEEIAISIIAQLISYRAEL